MLYAHAHPPSELASRSDDEARPQSAQRNARAAIGGRASAEPGSAQAPGLTTEYVLVLAVVVLFLHLLIPS